MTTLNVNTIKPAGSTLNLGESGDSVVLADDVKVNTVKDVGVNPLWVSNGSGVVSSVRAGIGGADKLLSTQTASNTTTIEFSSTFITSAYKEYVFKWINIHPVNDGAGGFIVYVSTNNGTDWDTVNVTSTLFVGAHAENNSEVELAIYTGYCLSQSTDAQHTLSNIGNANEENGCGEYHLFNPASTTYVKQFYSVGNTKQSNNYTSNQFAGGYYNTTTAINAVKFRMSSGNMEAGTIKLYGIAS